MKLSFGDQKNVANQVKIRSVVGRRKNKRKTLGYKKGQQGRNEATVFFCSYFLTPPLEHKFQQVGSCIFLILCILDRMSVL